MMGRPVKEGQTVYRWSRSLGPAVLSSDDSTEWQLMPMRPLPFGFFINALFYAAVLWLLIPGPVAMRRFIRRKRGQCQACGYPAGELPVCSECGKALPKRLSPTT